MWSQAVLRSWQNSNNSKTPITTSTCSHIQERASDTASYKGTLNLKGLSTPIIQNWPSMHGFLPSVRLAFLTGTKKDEDPIVGILYRILDLNKMKVQLTMVWMTLNGAEITKTKKIFESRYRGVPWFDCMHDKAKGMIFVRRTWQLLGIDANSGKLECNLSTAKPEGNCELHRQRDGRCFIELDQSLYEIQDTKRKLRRWQVQDVTQTLEGHLFDWQGRIFKFHPDQKPSLTMLDVHAKNFVTQDWTTNHSLMCVSMATY